VQIKPLIHPFNVTYISIETTDIGEGMYDQRCHHGNQKTARETYRKDEGIPLQRNFMNGINTDREIPPHLHLKIDVEIPVINPDKGEK